MAKISLDSILSGFNLSKINSNFQKIQDELNNKVFYRDNPVGEPNTITKDLDMNGKDILNVRTLQVSQSFNINGLDLATQVQNAANSATASSGYATQSLGYANQSMSYRDTAATYLDSFKKQYQGRLSSAPTVRYDGTALQIGDLYFDTTLNSMQVYGNSGWTAAGSSVNGTSKRGTFTYTSGTPTFTISGGYDAGYVDVFLNGYKLVRTQDFDDTSGTAITINGSLVAGDIVDYVAYGTFNIANVYTKSESDAQRTAVYSRIGDAMSVAGRNRIINGDMRIDQRNNGASVSNAAALQVYCVDRFAIYGTTSSKFTAQQQTSSPPQGFTHYLTLTSSSAYVVPSNEVYTFVHKIEGYNLADLGWGTAGASNVVLSFFVKSSLTGTFGGSLYNGAANRNYVFQYTINAANTWEQKTIVISGDTAGTWLKDNGVGVQVYFSLGAGSTYQLASGSWGATQGYAPTSSVSLVGTSGATLSITGVQLEAGTVATPFERVDYSEMVRRCQRYYEPVYYAGTYLGGLSGVTLMYAHIPYKVAKRTSSVTVTMPANSGVVYTAAGAVTNATTWIGNANDHFIQLQSGLSSGMAGIVANTFPVSAEL